MVKNDALTMNLFSFSEKRARTDTRPRVNAKIANNNRKWPIKKVHWKERLRCMTSRISKIYWKQNKNKWIGTTLQTLVSQAKEWEINIYTNAKLWKKLWGYNPQNVWPPAFQPEAFHPFVLLILLFRLRLTVRLYFPPGPLLFQTQGVLIYS